MSEVWLVAQHHFRQEVFKRSFIIVLFSLPLFLSFTVGMGFLGEYLNRESSTLGYVDLASILQNTAVDPGRNEVRLVAFETADEARAALQAQRIDAYFVLPADYTRSGRAELVFMEPPPAPATRHFRQVVRWNLLAGQPPQVVDRVLSQARVTVRALNQGREFPHGGPSAGQVVPLAVGVIFAFLIVITSGYLMSALAAERENRTMEIVMTSISPGQMMLGKVVAGLGMGLVLLVVWLAFFIGAAVVARNVLDLAWLQEIHISWQDVGMIVALALPAQLFMGAALALVGTLVGSTEEADQAGPFFFLIIMLPLYLLLPLIRNPGGTLAVILTLLPPTSVMTAAFRSLFSVVPWWQVMASAGVSLLSAGATTWLASKALRAGMLRYGKRLRLRDILAAS